MSCWVASPNCSQILCLPLCRCICHVGHVKSLKTQIFTDMQCHLLSCPDQLNSSMCGQACWRQHVSSYLKYVDLVTFDILLWFDLIIEPCSCQDVNISDTHVTYSLLSRMRILDISGDGDNTLEFLLLSWCKSWWNSSRRILIHHENQTETLFVQKSARKSLINAPFLSQSKWNFQHSSQQLVFLLAS